MLDTKLTETRNGGPLLCDIEETQRLIPVSRTTLWELGRDKKIDMVHIGRRRFFTYESIRRFVESLKDVGAGDAE
jgi:hypothetical protein